MCQEPFVAYGKELEDQVSGLEQDDKANENRKLLLIKD